jgi:lipopolysaccharide export system permease protein
MLGILHRQVFGELLRVFAVIVFGLTVLLVFVGVVGEAAKSGLGPKQIKDILPYIIPSLLPFTIPATLLLTACVVYGRMSSDNEITAAKAAGINILTLMWPSFVLGAVLSLGTLVLTDQFIPWARGNIERIVTLAMEDIFLDLLSTQNRVVNTEQGLSVTVKRVDGRKLISPTFRITPKGAATPIIIQAREAGIQFDIPNREVILHLVGASIETPGGSVDLKDDTRSFPLELPEQQDHPRNLPISLLRRELAKVKAKQTHLEERMLLIASLAIVEGHFNRLSESELVLVKSEIGYLTDREIRINTEIHSRVAMACSCFFFVTFGCPLAIRMGNRQFLTNFFFCFAPILVVYYPVVMLCVALAKSEMVDPAWGMWIANGLMACAGVSVLRSVLKH